MRSRLVFATSVVVCLLCSSPSRAQSSTHVLVVANESVPGSVQIAEEYLTARAIPKDHLLRLKISTSEEVTVAEFDEQIQAPIARWLAAQSAQDRILFIVLTKGVPLRLAGSKGRQGTAASVDSELALLYRRLTGIPVPTAGPIPNPYFAGTADDLTAVKPFSRATQDIYLVTRLDGFSVADAQALVKRSLTAVKDGRIVLDTPLAPRDARVGWIEGTSARLTAAGFADRVVLETTGRAVQNEAGVLGYVSWGSNDPALYVRHPNLTFVPGALAAMFLSADARTFVEPPAAWKPGPLLPDNAYAGSSQTLMGDLIRAGLTGVAGQVGEPYLDGAVRPDVLFPTYLKGFTLAESFYLATPYLSWQTVIVGDPLCAPFRASSVESTEPDPPLDPETELPARFSARRLAAWQPLGPPAVLKLVLLAQARSARGDDAGAVDAIKKAVATDGSSRFAWRALADAYERNQQYADAAAAHRRLLELDPNDVVALNNLAYNLAVRQNEPKEAYPLAQRAIALSPNNPTIADTLGWIQHLLGDDAHAVTSIERASRGLPRNAEIQFHAAVIYAKVERLAEAAKALALAAELDPALKERSDFRELQRIVNRKN